MTSAPATPIPPRATPRVAPPFRAEDLARQLFWDAVLRRTVFAALVVLLIAGASLGTKPDYPGTVALMAAIGVSTAMSMVNGTVSRLMLRIGVLLEHDAALAESVIADALRRRPLQPTVRLTIYHRLALLRHSQRRYAETAAICRAVLDQNPRWYRRLEPSLLLMLVDASLECHDLVSAYAGLSRLHARGLSLVESLHRLALQVRYEIACGHDAQALSGLDRKVRLIELMHPPTCGALHAMLAGAARRTGRSELADWFQRRARLLCTPSEFETYLTSRVQVTA